MLAWHAGRYQWASGRKHEVVVHAESAVHRRDAGHTSFQVRGLLALRAASTACWKWCNRTSVLARRPQLGMCTKMMRAASYSCASKHLCKGKAQLGVQHCP